MLTQRPLVISVLLLTLAPVGGDAQRIEHVRRDQATFGLPRIALAELAAELGLSRERVRQLQNEAEQFLKFEIRRAPPRAAGRRALDLREGISA